MSRSGGDVEIVGTARLIPCIVPELEEVLDVGMPRLQIDARRPSASPPLIDGRDRRIEGSQPGDDAVGEAVRPPDEAALRSDAGPGDPDAARELGELGDIGVALVDTVEAVVRGVEEVAARHLRVSRPGIEQGRARREVGQRRHQPVQADRFPH